MKEYFVSVVTVSLVGSMLFALAPSGGVAKNLKLLCALCTVACIVFPLGSIIGNADGIKQLEGVFNEETYESEYYAEIYNNSINRYRVADAEASLKNEIAQTFGIANDAFDLKIITDEVNGKNSVSCVYVYIYSGGLSTDPKTLEKYIFERLGCECEFVYDVI